MKLILPKTTWVAICVLALIPIVFYYIGCRHGKSVAKVTEVQPADTRLLVLEARNKELADSLHTSLSIQKYLDLQLQDAIQMIGKADSLHDLRISQYQLKLQQLNKSHEKLNRIDHLSGDSLYRAYINFTD
jgi:hypothetical protein